MLYIQFDGFDAISVDMSRSMIDAAKVIMESVRAVSGTDSVFYEKSGEVLKRSDQKVLPLALLLSFLRCLLF